MFNIQANVLTSEKIWIINYFSIKKIKITKLYHYWAVFLTSLNNDHKVQKLHSGSVSTDTDHDKHDYNTDKSRLYRLILA